jgi:hypothetical protein
MEAAEWWKLLIGYEFIKIVGPKITDKYCRLNLQSYLNQQHQVRLLYIGVCETEGCDFELKRIWPTVLHIGLYQDLILESYLYVFFFSMHCA